MIDSIRDTEGRKRYMIGAVEMWICVVVASSLLAIVAWGAVWVITSINDLGKTMAAMDARQQVMQAGVTTLSVQLADIPQLSTKVAELTVQVERNRQDIAELRSVRGLR
jgi:hypothetical protein